MSLRSQHAMIYDSVEHLEAHLVGLGDQPHHVLSSLALAKPQVLLGHEVSVGYHT